MKTYSYPAIFSVDRDDPAYINVRFIDFLCLVTFGEGMEDALYMARDCLLAAMQEPFFRDAEPTSMERAKEIFPDADLRLITVIVE